MQVEHDSGDGKGACSLGATETVDGILTNKRSE